VRASLPALLLLPVALTGCPALLSDWTIGGGAADDASADAGGHDAAGDSSSGPSGSFDASIDADAGQAPGDAAAPDSRPEAGESGPSEGGSGFPDAASDAASTCESLQGPTAFSPTNVAAGGITFHSQVNATLVQFAFHNGGSPDTVQLEDGVSCSVIASVSVPASVQAYTAHVSWPLIANKSYRLVNSCANCNYQETQAVVPPSTWPWSDGQNLVVDDCAGGADHCVSDASSIACGWSHEYWFNFTDLEICE
jgi:hypothetical protein